MRKMRFGWIALMLGWMLTHADEPLDQLVSYDQPACTVKQLLADLSRQTGITLFAPSPLDTEIVLVSVQKMPLKTLMEHLATVADGKWFKQPNGSYHLVRPPKLARERREQDNAQILAGLQRALRRKEPESMVEPLSLVPSDVLRTYARQKGKPIIALIPDSLAWWLGNAVSEPNTLQGYLEFLHWDTDLQEREDVILLKPRWSPYQWGQRADRLALSRWMQQLRQRGYPKLEDYLAVLQMYEQSGFANMVIPVYQSLTLPADDILEWIQGRHFSNRLSAKQLAYLQEGGQLTMKELSPVQREQLLRDIYFGYAELARVSPADGRPPAPVEGEEQEIAEVSLPHVFYSDGLPANLIIRLAREPSEVRDAFDVFNMGVFTTRRAGVWSGFRSIMNIAHDIHYAENPSLGGPLTYMQERANYYKTASLMPARRKPFRLEVRLGQRHAIYLTSRYYGMDLADYELLNEGKPATLDTLPDELKAKLERYLKLLKRE